MKHRPEPFAVGQASRLPFPRQAGRLPHDTEPIRWVWDQYWFDVLFIHWQVPFAALRAQVPARLEIDTHAGQAWVSLVLFRLRVRPWWLPFLPGLSTLVEVNVRTYVRAEKKPGIWFLSVHADNAWAIRAARLLTPMPYVHAGMCYERSGDRFRFEARRPDVALAVAFEPAGAAAAPTDGTLDAWLLERYRLFLQDRRDGWLEAQVAHPRWVTQPVDVALDANTLGHTVGLDLARPPDRTHFSTGLRARFGGFRTLGDPVPRNTPVAYAAYAPGSPAS